VLLTRAMSENASLLGRRVEEFHEKDLDSFSIISIVTLLNMFKDNFSRSELASCTETRIYTFSRSDFFAEIFQTAGLDLILYIV
jgi:hypothetical protein